MPMRTITFLLLVLGVISFQQTQSDIRVEGFLDAGHKISYGGGTIADTQGQYYAIPRWHDNQISKEEIDAYVEASNKAGDALVQQGIKKFYVGVTFRRYLSPEEFELLVKETGVKAKNYMLRATFPKIAPKERVGMFGRAAENSVINPKALERAKSELMHQARELKADQIARAKKSDPQEDEDWQDVLTQEEFKAIEISEENAVLNGVFTFEAETDAEGYQRLRKHALVYHVDVTAVLVFQQLKDYRVKWVDFVDDLDLSDYDTFWDMENIGLDKFRAK
ncbi:hypothetical protein FBQ82_14990 [Anaerolineae bacterium CFX7]|nr:hypothetical protein [Anaerolineae bacterium CFX7]